MSKNGMVVCSQPLASLAGVRVLMRCGNAVDATVATAAVLGVLEHEIVEELRQFWNLPLREVNRVEWD